jgi:predicted RNA-binding Zn ribbon-like protein
VVITGNPRESGADLAVNVVNTWESLPSPHDGLEDVGDLRIFLRAVGRAEAAAAVTERDLAEFRHLRGRLRRVFETDDVAEAASVLNTIATESGAVPRLAERSGGWALEFGPEDGSLTSRIAATATVALIEIVRAHGLTRFGTCAADPCTCAYVDRTKNRSKRYCCELCADRAAQRDHRARRRAS